MPISHIPIRICQTHCHTGSQGHPYQTSLPTALWQRPRHVLDLIFSTFPSLLPRTATAHRDPSTPLTRRFFNRRFPAEKEGRKTLWHDVRAKQRGGFSSWLRNPANPRQAETETRPRVRRPARGAHNSEFKPQRLPGGQSRRRLEKPTNHRPEAGQAGEGRGLGSVCFHTHRYRSQQRMVPCYPSAGREARPGYLNQPRF